MPQVSRKELSLAIAQLMPRIIQGVQLEFLIKKTLTQTQFLVLVAIHSRGPCPMNTLAQSMHVSMPTVSGIVDRLVKRGYITRQESSEDRRQVVVELSKKGQMMIAQFQGAMSQRWEDVLRVVEQNDVNDFHRVVTKLIEHLKGGK